MKPSSDIFLANTFSHPVGYLFTFWIAFFDTHLFLILMESSLFLCFACACWCCI